MPPRKKSAPPKVRELILTEQLAEEATWQHKLRAAAYSGIAESDVTEIVRNAVDRAKAGDNKAIDFVMKLLGTDRPLAVTNNLYVDGQRTEGKPTDAPPGTDSKVEAMAKRVANGEPVFHGRDRLEYGGKATSVEKSDPGLDGPSRGRNVPPNGETLWCSTLIEMWLRLHYGPARQSFRASRIG